MRTKRNGLLTLLLAFIVHLSFAQEKTVTGTVTDQDGVPLPGVNIVVQGTTNGTQTDFDGNYSIRAAAGQNLSFTYIGQKAITKLVGSDNTVNVSMEEDAQALEEVVITAQGIKREKKALGYAVATISSDEIANSGQTDIARTLTGKAPGVNITQTSGLAGSGTNIIIRGFSSINGSNQPLFIIDGIPFNTDTNNDSNFANGGANAGSRFLDIDPNNIKEVSVLKGLSATTLYGQAGRNGVILVTTKTGSSSTGDTVNNKLSVSLNQQVFASSIASLPTYQDNYGGGFYETYSPAFSNWGPNFNERGTGGVAEDGTVQHPYDKPGFNASFPQFAGARYEYKPYNSVQDFFNTGTTSTTSINASQSGQKASFSVGFGKTEETGFTPNNKYGRLNFSLGGSAKLNDRLSVQASMNYVRSDTKTPPTAAGFGSNPTDGQASLFSNVLYTPRSIDLMGLPFEDPVTKESVYYRNGGDIQNPRWTLKNAENLDQVRRFFGSFSTNYKVNDWSNLAYRVTLDEYTQQNRFSVNKGGPQVVGGALRTTTRLNTIWDHLLSYNFDKNFGNEEAWNINGTIGVTTRNEGTNFTSASSSQQFVYGIQTHQNYEVNLAGDFETENNIVGAIASLTAGYKNSVYLNLQGRNDWFSSLPRGNNSIFYPSASVSFVPTSAFESLKDSEVFDFLKVRFGYGSSAGFPTPYSTVVGLGSQTNAFLTPDGTIVNTLNIADRLGNENLKPELITELEVGFEAQMFDNRLGLDVSLYDKVSSDLILNNRFLDPSTGFTVTSDNLAEVSNKGIEVGINATVIRAKEAGGFTWELTGAYSVNENIVESLGGESEQEVIAGFTNLGNFAIPGEAYGVMQGGSIARDDNGNKIVQTNGNYLNDPNLSIIGDPNADWRATGITNFSYKGFGFRAQIEYTHGGDIYSTTAAALLSRGLVEETGFDRTRTFVLDGVQADGSVNTVQIAATDLGFRNSGFFIDEQAVWDATSIRLREVSLSYDFPKKLIEKTPFGRMSIAFIGQNVWFKAINFPPGLNFDPEVSSLGVGNGQGFDYLTGPTARRYGFSLNLTF